jgi:hypothetical protein
MHEMLIIFTTFHVKAHSVRAVSNDSSLSNVHATHFQCQHSNEFGGAIDDGLTMLEKLNSHHKLLADWNLFTRCGMLPSQFQQRNFHNFSNFRGRVFPPFSMRKKSNQHSTSDRKPGVLCHPILTVVIVALAGTQTHH